MRSHGIQQEGIKIEKTKGWSILFVLNFKGDKRKWKFKLAMYIAIDKW
jgi:hypothetical protein